MRRVRGGAGFSGDSFAEIYVDTNFIGMDSRQPLLLTCNGVTAEEMRNEAPSENANLFVFFPFFKMIFTEFAQVFFSEDAVIHLHPAEYGLPIFPWRRLR